MTKKSGWCMRGFDPRTDESNCARCPGQVANGPAAASGPVTICDHECHSRAVTAPPLEDDFNYFDPDDDAAALEDEEVIV